MPAERQRTVIDILTRMSGGQQTRREADKTSGAISKIGTTARRTEGHVNRLAGSLTHGLVGAAAIGFGAVATGLVLGTKKGLAFNATIENSVMRFGVFTKNAAEAKRLFGDIQTLNTQSTFGLGELAGATAYLGNAGLRVSKLPETMEGIANAVAAAGGGNDELQRAAVAIGQMAQNGVASREELNQLTEAGVGIKFLRGELGLTAKEYKNLGDQGISSNKVIDILIKHWTSGKVGKAAQQATKTFSGQLSNLGDQMDQVLGAATKPLFDLLKDDVFPQLLKWGNQFIAIFDPRFDFGDNLKLALDLFANEIVPAVVGELENVVGQAKAKGIDKQLGTMLAGGIDYAAPQIGKAIGSAVEFAVPAAVDAFWAAFKASPRKVGGLAGLTLLMSPVGYALFKGLMAGGSLLLGKYKGKGGKGAGAAQELLGRGSSPVNPLYVMVVNDTAGVGKKSLPKKVLEGAAKYGPTAVLAAQAFGTDLTVGMLTGMGMSATAAAGLIGYLALTHNEDLPTKGPGASSPSNPAGHVPFKPGALERAGVPQTINRDAVRQSYLPGTPEYAVRHGGAGLIGGLPPLEISTSVQIDGKEVAKALHKQLRQKEAQR